MPTTQVKRIETLERLVLSNSGNPRFRVTFTDGSVAITQSDAGFAYGLENRENRDCDVEVTFSRAGRITNVTPVK